MQIEDNTFFDYIFCDNINFVADETEQTTYNIIKKLLTMYSEGDIIKKSLETKTQH